MTNEQMAERITARLFYSEYGPEPVRLVRELPNGKEDGGNCRDSVKSIVLEVLNETSFRKPAETFSPCDLIREEMEARGWSIETLIERSGLKRSLIEELLVGHRKITAMTARSLAMTFGTSMELWLNMQR